MSPSTKIWVVAWVFEDGASVFRPQLLFGLQKTDPQPH